MNFNYFIPNGRRNIVIYKISCKQYKSTHFQNIVVISTSLSPIIFLGIQTPLFKGKSCPIENLTPP
jgi:hypothetical protein